MMMELDITRGQQSGTVDLSEADRSIHGNAVVSRMVLIGNAFVHISVILSSLDTVHCIFHSVCYCTIPGIECLVVAAND